MTRVSIAAITDLMETALGDERRRLVMDLHDVVGNNLSVISLRARTTDRDQALARLASIDELAQQTIRQMGPILRALRGRAPVGEERPTSVVAAVHQALDEVRALTPPIRVQ